MLTNLFKSLNVSILSTQNKVILFKLFLLALYRSSSFFLVLNSFKSFFYLTASFSDFITRVYLVVCNFSCV